MSNEPRFSGLIHDFLDVECSSISVTDDGDCDGDPASSLPASKVDALAMAKKVRKAARRLRALLDRGGTAEDPFRIMLAGDVARAAEEMAALRGARPAFRRAVASRLREAGYDAAVCQTRWRATREVAAGNYEFIDVVVTAVTAASGKSTAPAAGGQRYIVDVGFASEFVVARPTEDYHHLVLSVLPAVLVSPPTVVQKVVRLAGKAARRSLKTRGLAVPPWRKKRFLAAKWLGPHCRTTSDTASVVVPRASTTGTGDGDAACRTVGFVQGQPVQPWLVRT